MDFTLPELRPASLRPSPGPVPPADRLREASPDSTDESRAQTATPVAEEESLHAQVQRMREERLQRLLEEAEQERARQRFEEQAQLLKDRLSTLGSLLQLVAGRYQMPDETPAGMVDLVL